MRQDPEKLIGALQEPADGKLWIVPAREAMPGMVSRRCKTAEMRTPSVVWTTGKTRGCKVNADSSAVKACHLRDQWAASSVAAAEEDKGENI